MPGIAAFIFVVLCYVKEQKGEKKKYGASNVGEGRNPINRLSVHGMHCEKSGRSKSDGRFPGQPAKHKKRE
jgi:hypothetical protein